MHGGVLSKPPLRPVPSDDCAVTINGETYYPHEGETVWIVGKASVGELQSYWEFRQKVRELPSENGRPADDATLEAWNAYNRSYEERLSLSFDDLCQMVAGRVAKWDWTDDVGNPLPQPDGSLEPMKRLRTEELNWLHAVIQGESPARRGEESRPSETTSSRTARSRTKRG
jgi:hypothetical protein